LQLPLAALHINRHRVTSKIRLTMPRVKMSRADRNPWLAKMGCCSMDVKIRVCLPRKYGRFILFIDNNLLLPGARLHILNNIYRK
jgi:hypothetical protein